HEHRSGWLDDHPVAIVELQHPDQGSEPAESMKVTSERSIRKVPTVDSITASEAWASNAVAASRSISPWATRPSAVQMRPQVPGTAQARCTPRSRPKEGRYCLGHEQPPRQAETVPSIGHVP